MVPALESYQPSRLFIRVGFAASAGFVVCLLCALGSRFALLPTFLCALTVCICFWLAKRPVIRVSPAQLTIGERAIAWREIREINGLLNSPLIVRPTIVADSLFVLRLRSVWHVCLTCFGSTRTLPHLMASLTATIGLGSAWWDQSKTRLCLSIPFGWLVIRMRLRLSGCSGS